MREADERERKRSGAESQQRVPWLLVHQAFIQEMKRLTSPLCDRAKHTHTKQEAHFPQRIKGHMHTNLLIHTYVDGLLL